MSDKELIDYYSNAIGFIYPSLYEGFGIPPLEAQTCNCPVLLSDIPPLKEVFNDSGIYCNPYDINDIACKMNELKNYSDELKVKGHNNAQKFSWEKVQIFFRYHIKIRNRTQLFLIVATSIKTKFYYYHNFNIISKFIRLMLASIYLSSK